MEELFDLIDRGGRRYGVPAYNGGLFDPARHPFLRSHRVDDWHLARVIDRLGRARDPQAGSGTPEAERLFPVDYRDLAIEHLGGVYEGMLELQPARAAVPMAVVYKLKKGVREELYKTEPEARRLIERQHYKRTGDPVPVGGVFLKTDKDERRATGSYYTPDHVVRHIVEATLGPLCDRIGADLAREIAADRSAADADAAADLATRFDDRVLALRVVDPAMGSGHFLLRACSYLAEQIATHPLAADPDAPDDAEGGESSLSYWKRRVAENCLYGVDRNGMAVELAKLALWLETVAADRPLTFLDHRLRCGDSLIGARVARLSEPPVKRRKGERPLAGLFPPLAKRLPKMLAPLAAIAAAPSDTLAAVDEKKRRLAEFEAAREPFRRLADLWCAALCLPGRLKLDAGGYQALAAVVDRPRTFAAALAEAAGEPDQPDEGPEEGAPTAGSVGADGDSVTESEPNAAAWAADALAAADAEDWRPFHWELEYPAAYFAPPPADDPEADAAPEAARRPDAGFDAVIGNPPYDIQAEKELGRSLAALKEFIKHDPSLTPSARGKNDLYKLFVCRAAELLAPGGACGFIVPMGLLGGDYSADVRRHLFETGRFLGVDSFPQKDRIKDRIFPEAKLPTAVFVWRKADAADADGADAAHDERADADEPFRVRVHPGRTFEDDSPTLHLAAAEIPQYDPANVAVVSCGQADWDLAVRITASGRCVRLGELAESFQGEVNETTGRKPKRGKPRYVYYELEIGPEVIRGAHVCLYAAREASQGKAVYLDVKAFAEAFSGGGSVKASHHKAPRVGFQRKAPQNTFRRLIASPIPEGEFLLESVSYVPEGSTAICRGLLLAFLNSKLADWYFRLGSTNAMVSEYQFNALPFPAFTPAASRAAAADGAISLPDILPADDVPALLTALEPHTAGPPFGPGVAGVLVAAAERIMELEAARGAIARSDRSRLCGPAAGFQTLIDRVLYRLAGLTDAEAAGLEDRLGRML